MRTGTIVLLPVIVLLASCGSGQQLLKTRVLSEAEALKAGCHSTNLGGDNVKQADSLLSRAAALSNKGRHLEARELSERAVAHYRLALARYELLTSEKRIAAAEAELTKVKDQVDTYNRILSELRSARNP